MNTYDYNESLQTMDEQGNMNVGQTQKAPKNATGYWKCSCGRQNPPYTGTCACGKSKY